jgi:hypothetical protein
MHAGGRVLGLTGGGRGGMLSIHYVSLSLGGGRRIGVL